MGFFSSQISEFILKQIVSPPPDVQPSGDYLSILNQCARENGTTEVTREDLSKAYRGMRELPGGPTTVLKASVHCECSLALAFVKSRLNSPIPTTLIIGTSKSPCRWCRNFLVTFHDSYPHITIHFPNIPPLGGKLKSGWTLPPETPSKVVSGMHKRLDEEIKQVLARTIGTRVSHQIPRDPEPALLWRWDSETERKVMGNQHRYW